jgi:hypothetical protein
MNPYTSFGGFQEINELKDVSKSDEEVDSDSSFVSAKDTSKREQIRNLRKKVEEVFELTDYMASNSVKARTEVDKDIEEEKLEVRSAVNSNRDEDDFERRQDLNQL